MSTILFYKHRSCVPNDGDTDSKVPQHKWHGSIIDLEDFLVQSGPDFSSRGRGT